MSKKFHVIEAEFCVNTPLFLGGADPRKTAELRTASVKGAIRFWWRALAYGRCGGDVARMREEEAQIFGSTSQQAAIRFAALDVRKKSLEQAGVVYTPLREQLGARYLGYGLMVAFDSTNRNTGIQKKAGQLERPCLIDVSFSLRLLSKVEIGKDVLDALKLFGLLGGLGSRSRKGFGSVTLTHLNSNAHSWTPPGDIAGFQEQINGLLEGLDDYGQLPKISAFSSKTIIAQLNKGEVPLTLLGDYGEKMLRYRSWGPKGKIYDKVTHISFNSEKRFKCDHDWFRDTATWRKECRDSFLHPRRIVFGLPHNYGKEAWSHVVPEKHERRGSPLFFHVHRFGKGDYAGIGFVLESEFLPKNEGVLVKNRPSVVTPEFGIFGKFFEGKTRNQADGKHNGIPYFPHRKPLWPPTENAS